MLKFFTTQQASYVNICNAMEQRPSQKRVQLKNHRSRRNLLFIIVAIFTFSSCTITTNSFYSNRNIDVNLNAYNNGEHISSKKIALLVCNDASIPKHDLKNLELERYIKKMLEPKGYTFTSNNDDANIVIFYEYGISDPKVYTSQKVVPVWGQTGISSSRTEVKTDFAGRRYSETTYTPSYGVVSSNVITETKTTYVRWVNMSAFDADYYRKNGEDKMIWLTEVQSEGSIGDLRYIFPYMIVAASEYVGQNRTNRINVRITDDPVDKRVLNLKGTLVTVVINQATSGRKDPQATVLENVYRDGELIIKAGTPVKMRRYTGSDSDFGYTLKLCDFSTTSVYGSDIPLKGTFKYNGDFRRGLFFGGASICYILPVSLPMMICAIRKPKIAEGTILYLEME